LDQEIAKLKQGNMGRYITFLESFHVFAQELNFDVMLMKHVTKQVNDKEGISNHSSHRIKYCIINTKIHQISGTHNCQTDEC
jgi:hypothetical protein